MEYVETRDAHEALAAERAAHAETRRVLGNGQQSLMHQTVRIREALGGVGFQGDTEELARQVKEERDAALARVAELERALALIGDKAVLDWDDPTVGEVDRHVTPYKYIGWLRERMSREHDLRLRLAASRLRLAASEAARAQLREALGDFVASGVSFDDPRLWYVEMQVSRAVLEAAREALAADPAVPHGD